MSVAHYPEDAVRAGASFHEQRLWTQSRFTRSALIALMFCVVVALCCAVAHPHDALAAPKAPAKGVVAKATASKRGTVSITAKGLARATVYQFKIAQNKTFTKRVAKKNSASKKASFSARAAGEHWVKVRGGNTSGDSVSWGTWSKAKKITVVLSRIIKIPYVNQTKGLWNGKKYTHTNWPKIKMYGSTVKEMGCQVTCTQMAVYAATKKMPSPDDVLDWSIYDKVGAYKVSGRANVDANLMRGVPVMVHVSGNYQGYNYPNHYWLITGRKANGRYTISDPSGPGLSYPMNPAAEFTWGEIKKMSTDQGDGTGMPTFTAFIKR